LRRANDPKGSIFVKREVDLTRRQMVGAAGTTGVALLFGGLVRGSGGALDPDVAEAAATCVMTPAKTEGPYFVDERLNRADIRSDPTTGNVQDGVKLTLKLSVFDAGDDCAPVQGAQVDIWHANAAGKYSDESANGTSGEKWLRGYQLTDADGAMTFTTIYPGWYSGRAVHIHFKVRIFNGTTETLEFTSQLFFTDAMNSTVFANAPYSSRGNPDTTDSTDNVYGTDGASLLLAPTSDGSGGYVADFSVGISGGSSGTGSGSSSGSGTGSQSGTTDTAVLAGLSSVKIVRLAGGARQLRLRLKTKEPLKLVARVTRSGKTIAHKSVASLPAGTHTVKIAVGRNVKAGGATLRLRLSDAAGNVKRYERHVHIPHRD
jgi:protocatechuate 3,4-dioxygenase beta subunit